MNKYKNITERLIEYQNEHKSLKSASDVLRYLRMNNIGSDVANDYRDEYNSVANELGLSKVKSSGWTTAVYRVYTSESIDESLENIDQSPVNTEDLAKELVTNMRAKTNAQHKNRVLSKITRDQIMNYNALDEILSDIQEAFISIVTSTPKERIQSPSKKVVGKKYKLGIITLSDIHMNELIREVDDIGNEYSFDIAAKRIKQGIGQSIKMLKDNNITNVLLVFAGDFINSNRRDDEKMHMESSRGVATLVASFLLRQVIDDLSNHFNVAITYVTGNESRIEMDNSFSAISNTENYDFLIYHMVKSTYNENNKRVNFIDDIDPKQRYIKIDGFKLLIMHGENLKNRHIDRVLNKMTFEDKGVDLIISGHFHSTEMDDMHFRVGSICGANAYSAKGLQYYTRASMGIVLVDENNAWDGVKIDLQDAYKYEESYTIPESLRKWFVSPSKINNDETKLEITEFNF